MTTKTLALNNIERKIFWVLSTALTIVLSFYLYSALVITIAGVDRNNINRAAHELAVTSGSLEAEYLAEMNRVTLAYAQNLGFHEVNAKFTGDTGSKVAIAR
ncbi:MAG: hypothetical protein UW27_C0004G0052 [Parcubacteria group bacterium GW2011_GWA1_44_13]|uniref:Uncharacterized protein n=1 Tax=Candidatus Nomurabacteria bacterium GW2011_GWB1_44_12 TaxID=1618748 RepID=A0A837ICL7_9BACT|nr:MAG: hypothetical protein UW17_C0016G0003 [Candidatus Nomurabacteria bacterium GW2011_GWD1_44_10]KKT36571.1 MAG: hypothetical protein UW25_C0005G0053 [Candidatus Nomurabacteria bacterium GW2011_GWB1_44_12]KKT38197.1 MAG: hypothetical protein UW27_C0004G0052 [Parcubacteria group bacterium GW2011_GWA1_44_13]KKT60719.1 MAG: hypothetical protein UW54_C0005G0023 [Parcubacteria group bacterium GW2011_GWC1_44_26]HBB44243.1 hypothetical protein [Candidatus Yonathbacteria bacterium]